MNSLSPAEQAFVEHLIETGDATAAAVIAGVQPSVGRDPRVQSAIIDEIRHRGAVDAAYARTVLMQLAKEADLDSVRLRAATTIYERAMGKIPEQINIDVHMHNLPRPDLYAEIRNLIDELGVPPAITTDYEVVEPAVAQTVERECVQSTEVTGSSPVAGTYTPELPPKWR